MYPTALLNHPRWRPKGISVQKGRFYLTAVGASRQGFDSYSDAVESLLQLKAARYPAHYEVHSSVCRDHDFSNRDLIPLFFKSGLLRGASRISPSDYDTLSQWRWSLGAGSGLQYVSNGTTLLHVVLLRPKKSRMVDHRNGDRLDNRRENLRPCSRGQNAMSSKESAQRKRSIYRGVSRLERDGKIYWMARLTVDNTQHYLGLHPTEDAAARARDRAAIKMHGEFAKLNFPEDS